MEQIADAIVDAGNAIAEGLQRGLVDDDGVNLARALKEVAMQIMEARFALSRIADALEGEDD